MTSKDSDAAVGFSEVLAAELAAIHERRRKNGISSPVAHAADHGNGVPSSESEGSSRADSDGELNAEQAVRAAALDSDLSGITFSGGGIRSATFNLGVIQGLADADLLTRFDYLSTVSGGGYIGSWLAAWIKREGDAKNVEQQLKSQRRQQALAQRCDVAGGEVFDSEPEPVHHLRAFSNYLTPRLGMFAVDGWVLASIYIRNLLLNLLVLVPFLLGLIMSERLLTLTFVKTTDFKYSGPWEFYVWCTGMALYFVLLVVIFLWIHRSLIQIRNSLRGKCVSRNYLLERKYLHRCILIPLLALSILSTWVAFGRTPFAGSEAADLPPLVGKYLSLVATHDSTWKAYLLSGITMGIVVGAFHLAAGFESLSYQRGRSQLMPIGLRLLRTVLGLLTGFVGGMLLYGVFHSLRFMREVYPDNAPLIALTVGPPLFLVALILTAFLQAGLISRLWDESIREWWSSLSGSTMIYIAGWLFLFGVSIWGPWAVLKLEEQIQWIDTALLAGWSSAVGGGIVAIRRAATARGTAPRIFFKILPYVFVVGLIVLTSMVTDYYVPEIGPAESPEKYLNAVQSQKSALLPQMVWTIVGLFAVTCLTSARIDVNSFGLHALYKNRLVRCYLGASRPKAWKEDGASDERGAPTNVSRKCPRVPNPITGFDPHDDLPLARMNPSASASGEVGGPAGDEKEYVGPYHLICAALNLVHGDELAWQERKAESFVFASQHCGSGTTGYSPTEEYSGGVTVGEAVSISGAAVSPNMGYHSSGPMTALLAIFNMRLGAWLGNPGRANWKSPGPKNLLKYFLHELLGLTNDSQDYIYLSDGGHFENLGLYELVRRRCRYIVVCDSGADPDFEFQDLGGVIRKVRIDFGINIEIDVEALRPCGDDRRSQCHVAVGVIHYEDVDRPENASRRAEDVPGEEGRNASDHGILVYIKPSITGDEPQDVLNYRRQSPAFPHEPTTDQWFSESQFESYRTLGWHIAQTVLCVSGEKHDGSAAVDTSSASVFSRLQRHWNGEAAAAAPTATGHGS